MKKEMSSKNKSKLNSKNFNKIKYSRQELKKEFLFNVPTLLNVSRILLTIVIVYMLITNKSIISIVVVFSIAAITDFLDGKIARAYKLVNPFGAKADMVADRVLWVSVAVCMLIVFSMKDVFKLIHLIQLLFIMSREIVATPSTITYFLLGEKIFPNARYIAKITTFLQGFAFPCLMLSLFYPVWIYASLLLSIALLFTGTISGFFYIKDLGKLNSKTNRI